MCLNPGLVLTGKLVKYYKHKSKRLKDQEYKKKQLSDHMYIPVSYYACMPTERCFDIISSTGFASGSISSFEPRNGDRRWN